jgi:hypothetical protein
VDQRVYLAFRRGPDPLHGALAVAHRDGAVVAQPAVVGFAGQADHGRAGVAGELHGNGADAAGRGGDHDDIAG